MWQSIKDAVQAILDFFYALFLSLVDLLKDLLFFVLETLFTIVIALVSLVGNGFESLNPLQYFSAIPDETKAFMAMAGFNECMSILVGAISIRIILQLIPFVRLGS